MHFCLLGNLWSFNDKGSSPKFTSNTNPLSANLTKWLNTLKQFVGKLPTNCLSVFDHFMFDHFMVF